MAGDAVRVARRPARRVAWAAAAILSLGILAGLVPSGSSHYPDLAPAEAVGNPAGLQGIPFIGPPGTPIEDKPCEPILESERGLYADGGTGHIGHISAVNSYTTAGLGGFILPGTVDLWHLELDTYNNPRQIEGPAPDALGVIMGPDGFFRGRMDATVRDIQGPDLRLTDVHITRTYCLYGAIAVEGPYIFIDSTYRDPTPTQYSNLDLNSFYTPLFKKEYPNEEARFDFIMAITSVYDDPGLEADFTYQHLDAPLDLTLAPGLKFKDISWIPMGDSITSWSWSFGDGGYGIGPTPARQYGHAGVYTVCLTIAVASGEPVDPVCKPVTVNNRPPEVDFVCPPEDALPGPVTFPSQAHDPDGWVMSWLYEWGDGTSSADLYHEYKAPGKVKVRLTVEDDLGATASAVHDCMVPGPRNRPPVVTAPRIVRIDLGSSFEFWVEGYDPEGGNVALSGLSLPPGATFDPATGRFHWVPTRTDYLTVYFRGVDPENAEGHARSDLLIIDPRADQDHDGVADFQDVCPSVADPDQADGDRDGAGDACDPMPTVPSRSPPPAPMGLPAPGDRDADSVPDGSDSCPDAADPSQADLDADGLGDACDPDRDGDGVLEVALGGAFVDECPDTPAASRAAECSGLALVAGRLGPGDDVTEASVPPAAASASVAPLAFALLATLLSMGLVGAGAWWAVRRWK